MLAAYIILLGTHYVADYVVQTEWQAENKWQDNLALWSHCSTYTVCLMIPALLIWGFSAAPFILLNYGLHFATDYCTSRVTHSLWEQRRTHDFFVVLGLDQLIHQLTLAATMWLFWGLPHLVI